MTEVELFQVLLGVIAEIDAQFEFWLTVTFAVLVASHAAGERLNKRLRGLLALFYVWASAILWVRYFAAASYYGVYDDLVDLYQISVAPEYSIWAGILRIGLYAVGGLTTVILVLRPGETAEPAGSG